LHLASLQDPPFVDRPFPLQLAHFRVISLITKTDPTGYVVALSLLPAQERRETDGLDKFSGVYWGQEFHSILNDIDRSSLQIELLSKETVLGKTTLPLIEFAGGRPKKGNYELTGGNSIRLCAHFAPYTVEPFLNEEPEEYPPMSNMEFHIRVIEARGLRAADLNGFSDPYVKVSLTGKKKFVRRTRKILKTLNPKWNQNFQFDVRSIGNESLKLNVYDWDSVGGDDLIGKTKSNFAI
jgi:hypothetical protein